MADIPTAKISISSSRGADDSSSKKDTVLLGKINGHLAAMRVSMTKQSSLSASGLFGGGSGGISGLLSGAVGAKFASLIGVASASALAIPLAGIAASMGIVTATLPAFGAVAEAGTGKTPEEMAQTKNNTISLIEDANRAEAIITGSTESTAEKVKEYEKAWGDVTDGVIQQKAGQSTISSNIGGFAEVSKDIVSEGVKMVQGLEGFNKTMDAINRRIRVMARRADVGSAGLRGGSERDDEGVSRAASYVELGQHALGIAYLQSTQSSQVTTEQQLSSTPSFVDLAYQTSGSGF